MCGDSLWLEAAMRQFTLTVIVIVSYSTKQYKITVQMYFSQQSALCTLL